LIGGVSQVQGGTLEPGGGFKIARGAGICGGLQMLFGGEIAGDVFIGERLGLAQGFIEIVVGEKIQVDRA
jgi:hypothetical protein